MKNKLLLILCIGFFVAHAQINLSSSLSACYALNNSALEPINNLNGTLSAVTATVDRFNNANSAYNFSGTAASYIQLPDDPLLKPTNGLSFSAWVKIDQLYAPQYFVFTKNTGTSNFESYALVIANVGGNFRFRVHKSSGNGSSNFIDGPTLLAANTWYHVAFTMDNSSLKLYTNGVLQISAISTHTFNYQSGKNVYLGGTNETSFNAPFKGSMDNVRFYNRVINANEVGALYNLDPVCVTTGMPPVASFSASSIKVCEGGSITLSDLSINSPTSWNWQVPGASPPSASVNNPTFSFSNPGNFIASLTASNSFGASNTATQSIVVLPNPQVSILASSQTVCAGQSVTLVASGASGYTWTGTQQGPFIVTTPTSNSTYTVAGQDNNGCVGTASMSLQVFPNPFVTVAASKSSLCLGNITTLTASGALSYTWSNFQTGSAINVFSGQLGTGTFTYVVTGSDAAGCTATDQVLIVVLACTGMDESHEESGGLRVFPNPATSKVNVEIYSAEKLNYSLRNVLGELLVEGISEGGFLEIDLSQYTAGLYYLSLSGKHTSISKKIRKD